MPPSRKTHAIVSGSLPKANGSKGNFQEKLSSKKIGVLEGFPFPHRGGAGLPPLRKRFWIEGVGEFRSGIRKTGFHIREKTEKGRNPGNAESLKEAGSKKWGADPFVRFKWFGMRKVIPRNERRSPHLQTVKSAPPSIVGRRDESGFFINPVAVAQNS